MCIRDRLRGTRGSSEGKGGRNAGFGDRRLCGGSVRLAGHDAVQLLAVVRGGEELPALARAQSQLGDGPRLVQPVPGHAGPDGRCARSDPTRSAARSALISCLLYTSDAADDLTRADLSAL